jgi:AcrR family transcriptional regulator
MNESQNPPRVRSREATRAKLLDAAAEVFAEVGLGEASVERICERAGFTRGAFYSNFASKDEMFLELTTIVARERVDAVRARIDEVAIDGDDPDVTVIIRALDVVGDDRLTTMLMSEISIHAMRDAEFAAAYRAQIEEVTGEIVQLIDEITENKCLRLRIPSADAARIIVGVWSDISCRAAIAGLDPEQMAEQRTHELGQIVDLVLDR